MSCENPDRAVAKDQKAIPEARMILEKNRFKNLERKAVW